MRQPLEQSARRACTIDRNSGTFESEECRFPRPLVPNAYTNHDVQTQPPCGFGASQRHVFAQNTLRCYAEIMPAHKQKWGPRNITMDISTSVLIAAISAFIAALSALVSVWNFRREQLNQKIAAAKWKKEYFADLLKWSDEAMLYLSEAMHLCELDPKRTEGNKFFEMRYSLRVKISAHVDRGRWFFPNYATEAHGQHKHEAFRGYRPAVLDALVDAYRTLDALNCVDAKANAEHRKAIQHSKRHFTSEIQRVLDPRSRDEEFRKLLGNVSRV